MNNPIIVVCGANASTQLEPITVAKARRKYRLRMDISPKAVAVMRNSRVHGNTKLKPGDKLVFMFTHGTIG